MTREVVQIIDKETGDVNNLRDKKLADSTIQQQSGSASTDSVVMKTTGGDYVEIARDSFVGAIKSVMDGLIKGNSYTTLGANDPIAAFNSNALGGITPANLASVLGGFIGLYNKTLYMAVNEVIAPVLGNNFGILFVACSTAVAIYTKGHYDAGLRELVNYNYTGSGVKIFSTSSETQYSVYTEAGTIKIRKNSDRPLPDAIHIIYLHST